MSVVKHAFLIAAHHQFEILMKTLRILDDKDVDFYIHIDKKCKVFPKDELIRCCGESNIEFVEPIFVNWGGDSQIECTLRLLNAAVPKKYDYYHYISGVDMPIKPKEEILDYFESNGEQQYINFGGKRAEEQYIDRLRYHSFFQDSGHQHLYMADKLIRFIERKLGVDRTKKSPSTVFQYGSNWFSITHDFAEYVVKKNDWIKKVFSNTRCGDELFIQTLVINSPYRDQLPNNAFDGSYTSCLRYIDFSRGNPYVFTMDDYDDLTGSLYLFARKFDLSKDAEIVDAIFKYCTE